MQDEQATLLELFAAADNWRDRAACKGLDPDTFYPPKYTPIPGDVLEMCRERCPVQADCLSYAVEHKETLGWWGGTNPRRIRFLRRSLRSDDQVA